MFCTFWSHPRAKCNFWFPESLFGSFLGGTKKTRFTRGWGPKWHSQGPNLSFFSTSFFTLLGPILAQNAICWPPEKGPKKGPIEEFGAVQKVPLFNIKNEGVRKYPYLSSEMGAGQNVSLFIVSNEGFRKQKTRTVRRWVGWWVGA